MDKSLLTYTEMPNRNSISLESSRSEFSSYYTHCGMELKRWLIQNVARDWVILDYGADIGHYSLIFAQLAFEGLTYALEDSPELEVLRRNLAHHGIDNVRTYLALHSQDRPGIHDKYIGVDEFVEDEVFARLDCIRFNMDAFGYDALEKAGNTLSRFDPWLILDFERIPEAALSDRKILELLSWLRMSDYRYACACDGRNLVVRKSIPDEMGMRVRIIDDVVKEFEKPGGSRLFPAYSLPVAHDDMTSSIVDGKLVSKSYWDYRLMLADVQEEVKRIREAVGYESHLHPCQYGQIISVVWSFRPDLILVVGEGAGHATCALTQATHSSTLATSCKVVSVNPSMTWRDEVEPRLRSVMPESWFDPLDSYHDELSPAALESIVDKRQRVLLYWNDQSLNGQICLLGKVLPLVGDRTHLVIVHNIFDNRHVSGDSCAYSGDVWWRAGTISQDTAHFGHYCGAASLMAPLVDFLSRNRVELFTSDHSLTEDFSRDQIAEMSNLFGQDETSLFRTSGYWAYFSLNTAGSGPFIYPFPGREGGA